MTSTEKAHEHLAPFVGRTEWINRELCQRSLMEFTKTFWPYADPATFSSNWHLDVLCRKLEAVARGEIRRLIISVPPRTSKSTFVSVMLAPWIWTFDPGRSFLYSSYAKGLSVRDSLRAKRIIDSPIYQRYWGRNFRLMRRSKDRIDNDRQGHRIATSLGGGLTGEGGDIIVADDPMNAVDAPSEGARNLVVDWWRESMSTRLNDPKRGAYILIMQRLHHQDLTGVLLDQEPERWEHVCFPMRFEADHPYRSPDDRRTVDGELLWPSRFDEQVVDGLETTLGSYAYAAQLQQRPTPREGGMFKRGWWQIVGAAPAGGRSVRAWDLAASEASTGKWSAGVRMKTVGDRFYIEDVTRFRGSPHEVEKRVGNTAQQDGRRTLIDLPQDPGQAGLAQARYLVRQLAGFTVRYSPESGAKETRAEALSAQTEAQNVYLVRGPWNQTFIDEASHFPMSDYSDQIDAASRGFHRLVRRRRRRAAAQAGTAEVVT